jgi:hypothetical protein
MRVREQYKTPVIRCAVCNAAIQQPTLGLFTAPLCTQHSDMARGAFQWVECKIERLMSEAERIELGGAVIQCLREAFEQEQ